jgi:hypothetical protein
MQSTHDIIELMEDPDFKQLVASIIALAITAGKLPDGDTNLARNALLFANAVIAEADPQNAGSNGLKNAQEAMANDATAMLKILREHTERNGQSVLATMTKRPTLN